MIENNKKERPADIGGQAVLEGVMMKAPNRIAVAVRKPDGTIALDVKPYTSPAKKHKWMGYPVIRGVANMVSMLAVGMKTIETSSKLAGIAEEEPSKFELWLAKKLGKSVDKVIMGVAAILAVALSMGLFVALPSLVASLLNRSISSLFVVNLVSGLVRIALLIGYISIVSLVPEMRRTFEYHGAEHKTVYCKEAGLPLTPENAQRFSTLHPRCGTSFLLLVMILAILLGAVSDQILQWAFGIERLTFIARFARSLLLLPLVAGVSFEALKALAHSDKQWVKWVRWPGLMLQKLTTRKPSLAQLEVAIAAMKAALGKDAPLEKDDDEEIPLT